MFYFLGKILFKKMFRSHLVDKFKSNLNKLESKKFELESLLLNGADQVREHCLELRVDVDLATETAILQFQQHRDFILKQISDYEAETVTSIQIGEKKRNELQILIK